MKKLVIFTFIFSFSCTTYSQDTIAAKYYPLQIGNVWVYYGTATSISFSGSWYSRSKVVGTVDTLGKRYFVIQSTVLQISGNWYGFAVMPNRVRVDTANANIYSASSSCGFPETVMDSLKSRKNDTLHICSADTFSNRVLCIDTNNYSVFGTNRASKQFFTGGFESSTYRIYSKYIGLVSYITYLMGGSTHTALNGCVLNGILFGDTSMIVGINKISTEVPNSFSLYQNYPNPFNPSTKIKFEIPLSRGVPEGRGVLVKMVIFNPLGQEVAVLVNEQLQPGTYAVEWNAAEFPSGVYFYRLEAGNYAESKKMLMIK